MVIRLAICSLIPSILIVLLDAIWREVFRDFYRALREEYRISA